MSDDLPMGWVWSNIGDISTRIHYGYTASSTIIPTDTKLLRITDIQNNDVQWESVPFCEINLEDKQKYLLRQGDLVFARTGATVGKSFLIQNKIPEAVFASYLIRIILNTKNSREFVYYFFQSSCYWEQIWEGKIGTGQPNVNSVILSKIKIPIAPLNEQRRIVDKLDRIADRHRTARNELNHIPKLIARYKQAVLAAACSGKLTEDWRNEKNIEHYIQCTIANENISIPASWTIHTFQNLFKLIDGDRGSNYPKKEDYVNQGYCVFLSTKNVREYGFLFEEVVFISKEKHLSLRGGLLEKQDVVITTRGTLGNVALFDENVPYEVVRINSGMLILRKTNNNILGKFVILNIRSSFFDKQLQDKSSGSAQPQIPANILKASPIQG